MCPAGAAVGTHGLCRGTLAQHTERTRHRGAPDQPRPGVYPGKGLLLLLLLLMGIPAPQGACMVACGPPVALGGHVQAERLNGALGVWVAERVVLGWRWRRWSWVSAGLHRLPVVGFRGSILGQDAAGVGEGGVAGVQVAPVPGRDLRSFPGRGERGPGGRWPARCPRERAVVHGDVVVGVALESFTPVKHNQKGVGLFISCTNQQQVLNININTHAHSHKVKAKTNKAEAQVNKYAVVKERLIC